jgi:hypothetical protein
VVLAVLVLLLEKPLVLLLRKLQREVHLQDVLLVVLLVVPLEVLDVLVVILLAALLVVLVVLVEVGEDMYLVLPHRNLLLRHL